MRITCFSQVWIGFLGFGEADHRDEVSFSTDHTKDTHAINITVGVDADRDHLAEVAPVRWLHCQVTHTPFHTLFFRHTSLSGAHSIGWDFMIRLLRLCPYKYYLEFFYVGDLSLLYIFIYSIIYIHIGPWVFISYSGL